MCTKFDVVPETRMPETRMHGLIVRTLKMHPQPAPRAGIGSAKWITACTPASASRNSPLTMSGMSTASKVADPYLDSLADPYLDSLADLYLDSLDEFDCD